MVESRGAGKAEGISDEAASSTVHGALLTASAKESSVAETTAFLDEATSGGVTVG